MNLQEIIQRVIQTLSQSGIKCLLIGGYAVNYYGYTRNTIDVDFMITAEDAEKSRKLLKDAGFSNMSDGGTVLIFSRPDSSLRIDFLKTDVDTLGKLFQNAHAIQLFGATVEIPSLLDLLAMKFFALGQALHMREDKDVPDIAWLSILNKLDPVQDLLPLAKRFANETVYDKVVKKIAQLQERS
jgi:predicted nucleotidyltransferase